MAYDIKLDTDRIIEIVKWDKGSYTKSPFTETLSKQEALEIVENAVVSYYEARNEIYDEDDPITCDPNWDMLKYADPLTDPSGIDSWSSFYGWIRENGINGVIEDAFSTYSQNFDLYNGSGQLI